MEIDEPYTFGNADQKVDGTGPFAQRELARLLILKSRPQVLERQEMEEFDLAEQTAFAIQQILEKRRKSSSGFDQ